jgi:hypothetical protein
MFNNYPNPEQIWFLHEIMQPANRQFPPTTQEAIDDEEEIKQRCRHINFIFNELKWKINTIFSEEEQAELRSQLNPFNRPGEIFFGAEHYAGYAEDRVHEALTSAFGITGGLQQGGLMGSEQDAAETIAKGKEEIKGFLLKLAEKLGVKGMKFED